MGLADSERWRLATYEVQLMPRRRRPRRDPRSTRPGYLRRTTPRGNSEAWVFDVCQDRYVRVSTEGRVSDDALAPDQIPVDVAEDVYDDEDLDDA